MESRACENNDDLNREAINSEEDREARHGDEGSDADLDR